MNKKIAAEIVNYLDAKLANFTDGLNYWGNEGNKTDNSHNRVKECEDNISHLKSAYGEVYSMIIQLKTDYKL